MSSSQAAARKIMGDNFLDPRFTRGFGSPTANACLPAILWDPTLLQTCKDSHILVFVPEVSIGDMLRSVVLTGFFNDPELLDEGFVERKVDASWHLIRKTPVPDSGNKWWLEQRLLLNQSESVPDTTVLTFAVLAYFLQTGVRLFGNDYVRTTDVCKKGRRVIFHNFNVEGIHYQSWVEFDLHHVKITSELRPHSVLVNSKEEM